MTDHPADDPLAKCAEQFGFSEPAVQHLWQAVIQGGGDMAMFDHPEFAGPGQWMRGGLIMITEPANHVLRNRVDALCNELSRLFREQGATHAAGHRRINAQARAWDTVAVERERWWPAEFGEPATLGEQNDMAYAYFDSSRRLAIRVGTQVTFYDTGAHRITGIAQSQYGEANGLVFTSQIGEVALAALEQIRNPDDNEPRPAPSALCSSDEILAALTRLGALKRQGVLTEAEFTAKKQELLARL